MKERTRKKEFVEGLRNMKAEELHVKEKDLVEQMFWLQMKHRANQLEEKANLKKTKKAIARVKTILHQAKLSQLKGASK